MSVMNQAQLAALKALAPGQVLTGGEILPDYEHDEMPIYGTARPDAVVRVMDVDTVRRVMGWAYEENIPVIPRGAGTGLCGACVPVGGGIVLALDGMNRILEIDKENLTATCQCGVLLMELAAAVEEQGLFYPPDPGEKTATIGGNISTNAGGMRAVKYGVTRDYVRELKVVLPDGRLITLGGKTAKNSSGYSLLQLMIGAEGTLGVVVEATVRLIPLPRFFRSLLVPFPDNRLCMEAMTRLLAQRILPTAVEFMQGEVIDLSQEYLGRPFPDHSARVYLLLRFDGRTLAEVDEVMDEAARMMLDCGALDALIADTEERQGGLWTARGAFLEAIKGSTSQMDECDVVLPRDKMPDYFDFCAELSQRKGMRIISFGHAGDGNLHSYALRDELPQEDWLRILEEVMDGLYEKARELGGQVSGEHGIGRAKKAYLAQSVGADVMNLMRGVKAVFDPKGLLNPGKVI
jgi:glycolate oxidase